MNTSETKSQIGLRKRLLSETGTEDRRLDRASLSRATKHRREGTELGGIPVLFTGGCERRRGRLSGASLIEVAVQPVIVPERDGELRQFPRAHPPNLGRLFIQPEIAGDRTL